MTATAEIGASRRRKQDQRLITGRTRWTDNITLPRMLHMGVCINAWPIAPDQVAPTPLPVAIGRVSFTGEIVAVVVARSAAEARDAAELVDVEYSERPAALDLKEAAAATVLAHPDLGTNKSAYWKFDSAEAGTGGDVEAG